MNHKTLTATLAVAALALAPAAAEAQPMRTSAYELVTKRCFQISSGCNTITEICCASNIYAPPTWTAGSQRYRFTFRDRAGKGYSCYVYVRPTSYASGSVSC